MRQNSADARMKLWPALADKAFYLQTGQRTDEMLFFYDSPASGGGDAPFYGAVPSGGGDSRSSPLVVLIHGLGDEADSWRHIIPPLNSEGFRTLAPDLPGFGRSVAPGKITFRRHVDAVLTLIEAASQPALKPAGLSTGQKSAETREDFPSGETVHHPPYPPVFLAGNSMGALVAEAAALERPELVKGIILLDGTIPGGPPMPGPAAIAKLLFSRKWYRAYQDNPEAAWASLYPYYADLDAMPETDREFLKSRVMARVKSPTQERAFFETQRSLLWLYLAGAPKFAEKIRRFSGKILILWGERDRIMPLSSAEAFSALRADAKPEIIAGAGHLPQQEKPAETARLIAGFMAGPRQASP